ncbi:endoglucanase [Methanobrevibacter sp.]|uniref:endoglucanase n=1 Tax=Methanobrevibacter sp. TaxID=66852 RepID=UPI00388E1148
MDKANVIISVIIVLCIAAAVAAYGLTNSNNPIFSDLSSMGANANGNGLGNNSTHANHNLSSVATTSGSNGGDSGAGAGTGYSDGSGGYSGGSDSGSSSYDGGSSDSGSSDSGSGSSTHLSYSEAQSIANSAVGEPGCYAGGVYYSGGVWYATIYDENGNAVDSITIDDATGSVGRG